ncbi:MAG: nucleotide exchange factor GrpE [Candidatus Doudnabacteria bacterium]|nr:nucleotide exchange factor GrpE [Candidatus Doudnabacteria bacterium]
MPDEDQQNNNHQNSDITLEKLQADLDNAILGWKRTAADFENFKKQKERENTELLEFAKEVTVVKLLPILDALEQALRHMPETVEHEAWNLEHQEEFMKQYRNWQTGVNGIVGQLDKVLGELGVKKIEAIGKKFDPHFHEAVREVESEKEDGIILDELQSGFILNGKIIRPSQAIISKKSSK